MKPIQKDIEKTSNLPGRVVPMGFHVDSLPHLMDMYVDQYNDAQTACIREYSTNARDSHVEAGQKRPIEITLPVESVLGDPPVLRIRDWGTGLNEDDIVEVYSQYGASTKRESDDFNGTLGLGCKAALAYTPQFTLIGSKDGISTTVIISREAAGGGSMTVVDTHPTNEPNGVEIIIPAKKFNDFADKAAEFFKNWEPGTVLVDGEEPEHITGLPIGGDDLLIVEKADGDYEYNRDVIVMGGVAYPTRFRTSLNSGYSLVAFVDIGNLKFAPNREQLLDEEPINKSTIKTIEDFFRDNAPKAVQEQIDKAANRMDALKEMIRWQQIMDGLPLTFKWKDEELPRQYRIKEGTGVVTPCNSTKLSKVDKRATLGVEVWHKTLWVTGWDRPTFTATQKKKLKWYIEEILEVAYDDRPNYFALLRGKQMPTALEPWVEQSEIIDWATIHEIKLPRSARDSAGRIPGSYDLFEGDDYQRGVPGDDIDTSNPVYFTTNREMSYRYARRLNAINPGMTLVELAHNRVNKFRRLFPNAIKAEEVLRKAFASWSRGITPKEKRALALRASRYTRDSYAALKAAEVKDPEVKQWIYALKKNVEHLVAERKAWRDLGYYIEIEDNDPLDRYPLYDEDNIEHSLLYLNAAYEAGIATAVAE